MSKEIDTKNADVIRKAYSGMGQSLASAIDLLDEPWKSQFTAVKAGLDKELEALPPSDQIPAALAANNLLQSLFSQFCNFSSMFTGFTAQLSTLRASVASAQPSAASLASAVDAEIAKRIQEGKLFDAAGLEVKIAEAKTGLTPKAEVESLCSAAKLTGIAEGKSLERAAQEQAAAAAKKIEERKTACSTASIPLPAAELEKILGGTDEEFTARKTKAETRLAELAGFGVSLASADGVFGTKLWADDAAYNDFRDLVKTFASEKPDVFATGGARKTPAGVPAMLV